MSQLERRVTELEVSLAHQQRLCEQLNEVVTLQTRDLIKLNQLLPVLQEQIRELRLELRLRGTDASDPDERPPHY